MALLNNYIKVKELTDNLEIDGMLEKYDDTSPYMFAKIQDIDKEALHKIVASTGLDEHIVWNSVLVFKRVTKVKGFLGYYVQVSDLIEIIDTKTYNKYVYK